MKRNQFEYINQKRFYRKQVYAEHFLLNSKKSAIFKGKGVE